MQIYCAKCDNPQSSGEKYCQKCGAKYGGESWVLIIGFVVTVIFPIIWAVIGDVRELIDLRFFFWYLLPAVLGTAIIYDYNPKRIGMYFFGGTLMIGISLYYLL